MEPHSSTLGWKIPWTEEPGGLQSMGLRRVGHDWVTSLSLFSFMHWKRQWQPTPVFSPGESQGWGAWWAAVYGVALSQTWLKRLSSSSSQDLNFRFSLLKYTPVVYFTHHPNPSPNPLFPSNPKDVLELVSDRDNSGHDSLSIWSPVYLSRPIFYPVPTVLPRSLCPHFSKQPPTPGSSTCCYDFSLPRTFLTGYHLPIQDSDQSLTPLCSLSNFSWQGVSQSQRYAWGGGEQTSSASY